MADDPTTRLPYWPAALNHKMAAAYCGVSVETFKKICPVKPMQFTGSKWGERFLRQRLDEWLFAIDPNSSVDRPSLADIMHDRSTHLDAKQAAHRTTNNRTSWKERDGREIEPSTGPGGYPIVDDPTDPLRKWYDQLGFDPKTMGEEDMQRLHKEAEDRWKASIPGTPLTKRERTALEQLAAHGSGHKINWQQIKHCGPDTEERLKARGFIETSGSNKFPDRSIYYMLTDAGFEAWKRGV